MDNFKIFRDRYIDDRADRGSSMSTISPNAKFMVYGTPLATYFFNSWPYLKRVALHVGASLSLRMKALCLCARARVCVCVVVGIAIGNPLMRLDGPVGVGEGDGIEDLGCTAASKRATSFETGRVANYVVTYNYTAS